MNALRPEQQITPDQFNAIKEALEELEQQYVEFHNVNEELANYYTTMADGIDKALWVIEQHLKPEG